MSYESGSLRNIRIGDDEVLRMIYIALRNYHWRTITPTYKNEKHNITKSSFDISYDSVYMQEDIHFKFHVSISGEKANQVIFDIDGVALS